jgi:tRNA1(Val) A37 N6-methylase TrmN6
MPKIAELYQLVARAIDHITWNIPHIRDGNRWRIITNPHLVENPTHVDGYDHFENAMFRAKEIMEERGWITKITDTEEQCHEHLIYRHYRLRCWK